MIKIIKLIPFLLLLTACTQGVIFYDIDREIKLEEANIIGNINSIVKMGDTLYTQNGNVYKKPLNTVRGWTQISNPEDERVIMLASDESNLYALTAKQLDEEGYEHSFQVWVLIDGIGDWQKVAGGEKVLETEEDEDPENAISLFDNGITGDSENTVNRVAYVRIDSTVKRLSGATATDLSTQPENASSIIASARIGGTDYFSDTRTFCSNGIDTLYAVIEEKVQSSTDGSTWSTSNVSITDATLLVYADNNILYAGTYEGIEQVNLDGKTPVSVNDLGSNAEATTGEKEIIAIGYFGDSDSKAIYVGAIDQYKTSTNGLWGYYPDRGNWNFE